MRTGLIAALVLAVSPGFAAADDDSFAEFRGAIGVIPVSSGVVAQGTQPTTADSVNRNFVRGVPPAGQLWVMKDLHATIDDNGKIRLKGKGLLFGGGNNTGYSGNVNVKVIFICETAAPFIQRTTDPAGVTLDDAGDFWIQDHLSPWPPGDCERPVLLVTNLNGAWFAAGIPDLRDDERDGKGHDDEKDDRKDDKH